MKGNEKSRRWKGSSACPFRLIIIPKKNEKKKSKSGFRRRARAMGGKVAVISFRFKDVDIIDVGLIVED